MKVIVVMPAYYAEKTLKKTYEEIPKKHVHKIILVDDASKDKTVQISRSLGIKTIVHNENRGYGGNQKTCYNEALKMKADIAVMLHPDYQYDPKKIPELIRPIKEGRADVVFGSRLMNKKGALEGGMPLWKYIGNRCLTLMINLILGEHYTECHSGYRAYNKKTLESIKYNLNSNDFVFDVEMLVECTIKGLRVAEIAIPTRYFKEASSPNLRVSVKYGLDILRVLGQYLLFKSSIKKYKKFS